MKTRHVVSVFLRNQDSVLILKRSSKVGSYRGRWAAVSGSVEDAVTPLSQAMKEIEEETGLCGHEIQFVKAGKELKIEDRQLAVCWVVHPFLFEVRGRGDIRLDWEHTEFKWIKPVDLELFETVPRLDETMSRVL